MSKAKSKGKSKISATPLQGLHTLLNTYISSSAFTKWLAIATGLPLEPASNLLARRFRRGLDYTLATNYEDEDPLLEICLGLTPTMGWGGEDADEDEESDIEADADQDEETTSGAAEKAVTAGAGAGASGSSSSSAAAVATNGEKDTGKANAKTQPELDITAAPPQEEALEIGGYEVYMASDEALQHPPNTTSSSTAVKNTNGATTHSDDGVALPNSTSQILSHTGAGSRVSSRKSTGPTAAQHDPAVYRAAADDEADDGILLSNPAGWNMLNVVLRDKGVLKFVKYVSRSAPGDRWDLVGEWRVGEEEEKKGVEEDREEVAGEEGGDSDEEEEGGGGEA